MEYDTIFAAARRAGNELALVDAGRLSRTVVKAAALLRENAGKVLAANALDLEAMDADSPMRDRLRLTAERIASIAADMESVAGLPSPQGETIAEWTRPNGMTLRKVRVPFGVVGMICEASRKASGAHTPAHSPCPSHWSHRYRPDPCRNPAQ